jgi:hypothetical protein
MPASFLHFAMTPDHVNSLVSTAADLPTKGCSDEEVICALNWVEGAMTGFSR